MRISRYSYQKHLSKAAGSACDGQGYFHIVDVHVHVRQYQVSLRRGDQSIEQSTGVEAVPVADARELQAKKHCAESRV